MGLSRYLAHRCPKHNSSGIIPEREREIERKKGCYYWGERIILHPISVCKYAFSVYSVHVHTSFQWRIHVFQFWKQCTTCKWPKMTLTCSRSTNPYVFHIVYPGCPNFRIIHFNLWWAVFDQCPNFEKNSPNDPKMTLTCLRSKVPMWIYMS